MRDENGRGMQNMHTEEREMRAKPDVRRSRAVLLAVLTAIFAFAGLGAWAIASPVGAAPDDDFHLASIWCSLGEREGLCAETAADDERTIPARLIESSRCFSFDQSASAQCPLNDEDRITTDRGNFAGNYPPVFYSVMGLFASPDIAVSTVLMRLFNAALFVGAVSAVIALLRPGQRGPIVWSSIATLVPLGVFLIPSVNPSSWAILAGLLVWVSLYGYFTAETLTRRISLGAIAAVLAVMGAGARGDSAVYVAFAAVVATALAFERRSRSWLKLALLPLAIVVVGACFFLVAGQTTGTVRAAEVQSSAGGGAGAEAATAASSAIADLISNVIYLPWLWTGGTGTWALGWLDTPVPQTVWVVMIVVLGVVILRGIGVMPWRKALVTVAALGALTVIPLYVLYGAGVRVGEWVQPRYLLPLLAMFVGIAVFGFAKDHLGFTRLQAAVLFSGVAIANSLALHNNMRRYISGLGDRTGFNLNASIEWWWNMPFSPMVVWFAGSAAFALMLAGLFLWLYPRGERPALRAE